MLRVSQFAALALASAVAAAAPAPCPEQDRGTLEEWKCFGEVDFTSRAENEDSGGARFVVFANGERLYEKREGAGGKAVLMGAGWSLYHGLSREDSTVVGAHHPFIFFEFALLTPMIVLAASGRAPSAIPNGTTPVSYTVDSEPIRMMREIGIRSATGSIERDGASYVFSAETTGNVATGLLVLSIRGRWSSARGALCRFDAARRMELPLRAERTRRARQPPNGAGGGDARRCAQGMERTL